MKCNVSILGGGVARDLLKGLEGKSVGDVSWRDTALASFSLRQAYQYRAGKWNGHTWETSRTATGGLVAWADIKGFPQCYSRFRQRELFRIGPKDVPRAERLINQWVTRLARAVTEERWRVNAVEKLDQLCKPYLERDEPDFGAWVERQEKVFGESDYSKLSLEDCAKWTDAIRQWAQANELPFNVNPNGQAGMGWAL